MGFAKVCLNAGSFVNSIVQMPRGSPGHPPGMATDYKCISIGQSIFNVILQDNHFLFPKKILLVGHYTILWTMSLCFGF